MQDHSTLVIVANGDAARFLARSSHTGCLVELVDHHLQLMRSGADTCEDDHGMFLGDVASRISEVMASTRSEDLLLCAESDTLRSLRSFLSPNALAHARGLDADLGDRTPAEVNHCISLRHAGST